MPAAEPSIIALVVDDDPDIRELVAARLLDEGLMVVSAGAAGEARRTLREREVHVLILDLNLPDGDGVDLCRGLRTDGYQGAIIMVSARDAAADRILGLEFGADDYLIKPFEARELVARVRSVLRRTARASGQGKVFRFALFSRWRLDLLRRRLIADDDRIVMLTSAEFRLLQRLVESPGVALAREELQPERSATAAFDRSADMVVSRLRQKLGTDANGEPLILTVRNEGYLLAAEVALE